MIKTCSVKECARQSRAHGYCLPHYKRLRRGTKPENLGDKPLRGTTQVCKIDGCSRPLLALGMCNAHYLRKKEGRDMESPIESRQRDRTCAVEGCNRKHYGHGVCKSHYNRMARRIRWAALIKEKGGCCSVCKGVFPIEAYDLHHRDPSQKESSVSLMMGRNSWESIQAEAEKCDLVCANCHRSIHAHDEVSRAFAILYPNQ